MKIDSLIVFSITQRLKIDKRYLLMVLFDTNQSVVHECQCGRSKGLFSIDVTWLCSQSHYEFADRVEPNKVLYYLVCIF